MTSLWRWSQRLSQQTTRLFSDFPKNEYDAEPMNCITLHYGADDPLILEVEEGAVVANCVGPEGVKGIEARTLVAAALSRPLEGPSLQSHAVPGDRVVVALAGEVPQAREAVGALMDQHVAAGVARDTIGLLRAECLEPTAARQSFETPADPAGVCDAGLIEFDPATDADTAYLAADEEGRPLYLARPLVDADVVVAVGSWSYNAALGGRSLEGELWPTFSRHASRHDLLRCLAKRGRRALAAWRANMQEIAWQLGVATSLRLVAGRGNSLAAATFGLPDVAARQARAQAAEWSPKISGPAMLAICSLAHPQAGCMSLIRGVAAAARVTQPAGTICIASRLTEQPGLIFSRWRQGAPLEAIVREAIGTGDRALIADALQTRLFARAIGDRRLVLPSDLEEGQVEDLEFGYAATPEVVERLAHRSDSLVVLHEADQMFPRLA